MTPFEEIYGQNPPSILSYMPGVSKVHEVDTNLTICEAILPTLKEKNFMDQNHMKKQENQGHYECHFVEGDQVFLRIQPYKKTSLKSRHC
jgi:hypothetical protein